MFFLSDNNTPLRRRSEVVFWCFAIFMMLLYLGCNALWGLEGRCSEIVREMLLTGDLFTPQINGVADTTRLPLSYWVMLPATILFGLDEFAMRLPAVIAALITLWATRQTACKLFDEYTALLSMWILLSTYSFVVWARLAAPDMANTAAVSCAVVSFLYWHDTPDFKDYFSFYLLLATGSMFKGIPMVAVVILLILPLFLSRNQWKIHLNWRHLLALVCGACAGVIPYSLFCVIDSSDAGSSMQVLWHNHILRFIDIRNSGEPIYSYLYNLPRVLLPWSAVFFVGFFIFIKRRKELTTEFISLLYGIVLAFLLFSFSGSRAWYYLLPLVPFCAIVSAAALNGFAGSSYAGRAIVQVMRFILMMTGSLALALPIALPLQGMIFNARLPGFVIAAASIAGFAVLVLMTFDQGEDNIVSRISGLSPRIASLVLGTAVAVTVSFCVVIPGFTEFRTEKPFLLELRQKLDGIAPENIFCFGKKADGRLMFYLAPSRPVSYGVNLAEFFKRTSGTRVAVISENNPGALKALTECLKDVPDIKMDINKPTIVEKHLAFEPAKKDKYRAWIFEVPGKLDTVNPQRVGDKK